MSNELLTRGVSEVIPGAELQKKLESGESMKIYLGVDPTGPSIHLGHAVILRKMREFQKLGHKIILLIGDFTARIGDPTDKDAARTVLTHQEVLENANTYQEQAAKILDFDSSENPAVLDYNSKWLDELKFQDVLELSSEFTVQQMLERDMFENRMKEGKPIHVHEFMYPIMQGYDSVALDVDMEFGGTDQLFNMLAGRTLLKKRNGKEKVVMTFELLEGTDGRKMSKSYNNIIGVTDSADEMFGKILSLKDELIPRYFELATDVPMTVVQEAVQRVTKDPRDLKVELAREIVSMYHNADAAAQAEKAFFAQFADKQTPTDIPEYVVTAADTDMVELLINAGLAESKGKARRLMEQGGVRLNDTKMTDASLPVEFSNGDVVQVGKRRFVKLSK